MELVRWRVHRALVSSLQPTRRMTVVHMELRKWAGTRRENSPVVFTSILKSRCSVSSFGICWESKHDEISGSGKLRYFSLEIINEYWFLWNQEMVLWIPFWGVCSIIEYDESNQLGFEGHGGSLRFDQYLYNNYLFYNYERDGIPNFTKGLPKTCQSFTRYARRHWRRKFCLQTEQVPIKMANCVCFCDSSPNEWVRKQRHKVKHETGVCRYNWALYGRLRRETSGRKNRRAIWRQAGVLQRVICVHCP